MSRRSILPVVVLTVATLLAACAPAADNSNANTNTDNEQGQSPGSTTPPSKPEIGGALVVGIGANPANFTPCCTAWTSSTIAVAKAIYDPLMAVDVDGKVQPYLAESVTPNADFKEWTFKLRPGVTFHNDEPFDAAAFKLNFDSLLKGLITAQAVQYWDRIEVVDNLTAKLFLKTPSANLPVLLSGSGGYMVAPAQLSATPEARKWIGTGPFRMTDWVPDSKIVGKKNENYWRTDAQGVKLPYLAEIKFNIIPDPTSMRAALRAGDIDVMQTIDPQTIGEIRAGTLAEFQSHIDSKASDKQFLPLNMATGTFKDPKARLALIEATDQKAFIDTILPAAGKYKPAGGPFDAESPWGQPTNWPKFDPAHARELLKEVGGGQPVPVTLSVIAGDTETSRVGQYLKEVWDAVGFDVRIQQLELNAFAIALVTAKSDLLLFSFWYETDPDALYHFFSSETATDVGTLGLNFARWKNEKADAALQAGRRSNDPDERKKQYQAVWEEMGKDLPYLFLYNSQWALIWRPDVFNIGNATMPGGQKQPAIIWGSAFYASVWVKA